MFNEVLFPRKRSPFPKRGRHSLSPSERVTHSAERGHRLPLWGRWRRSRRKRSAFPFGEGVGTADGRGLEWRHSRRERSTFPFGEGGGTADGRGPFSPLGKVAAQPTEEVCLPLWGRWRHSRRKRSASPFTFIFILTVQQLPQLLKL